jgi:hypothetical protein
MPFYEQGVAGGQATTRESIAFSVRIMISPPPKTALRGPPKTPSVISSPLKPGRQCMKMASGLAQPNVSSLNLYLAKPS